MRHIELPHEVQQLVELCKREMQATEVWLFGSRARGDHHEDSDYDLLAVVPDDAPADIDSPQAAFRLRRKSGAHADLLTARKTDFNEAKVVPTLFAHTIVTEGVRLDKGCPFTS
ncbi:nucleotidyltransferase domain-containing protein [Sulfitobacter delicatus]|uniref:Nucleotidyltransferase domain-containing protein n=1 Tax=Sulfitobacter delicatus TaxID=218672 RepID=A0A1G7XIK1_9RHOB|nr:nucleotidyltransferase domain-containing protein [Sulfitobacter delicatus]SDG83440.1 Nucleotidyltransferase domain-containing protein [Sulfitobacter delicatus]